MSSQTSFKSIRKVLKMNHPVKFLKLVSQEVLISQVTEVSAELGDPNCKLIEPYEIWEGPNLAPWLMDYTHDNEIMIRSEQILTMCDPSPKLLEKYKSVLS
jgi:hypothetical protein